MSLISKKNNEQQTENKQQNQQHNNETKQREQNEQQQQHPKLTIKSRGIEITDMKKYLAEKRKERAARVVEEKHRNENKVNSARSLSNFTHLLDSAREDGTVGIRERNEPDGSNSSAAKGISKFAT